MFRRIHGIFKMMRKHRFSIVRQWYALRWTFFVQQNKKSKYFCHRYLSVIERDVIVLLKYWQMEQIIIYAAVAMGVVKSLLFREYNLVSFRHLHSSSCPPFCGFPEEASTALRNSKDVNKWEIRNELFWFLVVLSESLLLHVSCFLTSNAESLSCLVHSVFTASVASDNFRDMIDGQMRKDFPCHPYGTSEAFNIGISCVNSNAGRFSMLIHDLSIFAVTWEKWVVWWLEFVDGSCYSGRCFFFFTECSRGVIDCLTSSDFIQILFGDKNLLSLSIAFLKFLVECCLIIEFVRKS